MAIELTHSSLLDPSISRITILPTEKCNLRCTYCYESHEKGSMTDAVAQAVTAFLARHLPGKRRFYLSWFGGEPLLEKSRVLEITKHCFDVCNFNEVSMETEITTNAIFLDDDFLSRAAKLGRFVFQITLDGSREHHNRQRIGPKGQPTFDAIIGAINRTVAHEGDFSVMARIHFDANSAASVIPFAHEIRHLIGNRGKVFVRPIAKLGGAGNASIFTPSDEVARDVASKLSLEGFMTLQEEAVCYASLPNSLVIRSDGRVAKCTVALADERNNVGFITPDGKLSTNDSLQKWFSGWYDGDLAKLKCPYSSIAATPVEISPD